MKHQEKICKKGYLMTEVDTNNKKEIMTTEERSLLFSELKSDILKTLVRPAILKVIWSTIISAILITFTASGIYYSVKSDVLALKNSVNKLEQIDVELWKQKSNKTDLEYIKREIDNIKEMQLLILNKIQK